MAKSTPPVGLEPTTARLRAARSTDWARKATNETILTTLFYQYYNHINITINLTNKHNKTYQYIHTRQDMTLTLSRFVLTLSPAVYIRITTEHLHFILLPSLLFSTFISAFYSLWTSILPSCCFFTDPFAYFLCPFSLPWYTFSFYIC